MKKTLAMIALGGLVSFNTPAVAHHAFTMFDSTEYLELTGTVTSFSWRNPHVMIDVEIDTPEGPETYSIECSSPNIIGRRGWSPTMMHVGDEIDFVVHPRRDGSSAGLAVSVTLPDGTTVTDKT